MGINIGVSSAVGTYLPLGGGTLTGNFTIGDDLLLRLGTTLDQVFLNRSTTLNANTAVTSVLVGTPVTPALTANSLIISNITTDGDILIAASDGGHSRVALYFDASTPDTYLYNVGGTWTAGATTWTIPAVTLGGAVAGGDKSFTGVGDMTFTAGSILASGGTNADTLLLRANDTTFITFTTGATDACELDACILDTSVAKGTWTASGTWTIPAVTLGGTITGGSQVINSIGHIGIVGASSATTALSYVESYTVTDNGAYVGFNTNPTALKTTAAFSGYLLGLNVQPTIGAANTQNWTTAPSGLMGVWVYNYVVSGATGTITGSVGIQLTQNINAATVTNVYGLYMEDAAGAGTVTNQYGIYIANMTKGGTLNYAIYSAGGLVHFAGAVDCGSCDCGTTCEANAYTVGGAAGATGTYANVTVVGGIVTSGT